MRLGRLMFATRIEFADSLASLGDLQVLDFHSDNYDS